MQLTGGAHSAAVVPGVTYFVTPVGMGVDDTLGVGDIVKDAVPLGVAPGDRVALLLGVGEALGVILGVGEAVAQAGHEIHFTA